MNRDIGHDIPQAMEFKEGYINLTSTDTIDKKVTVIHCVADGGLDLTFPGASAAVSVVMTTDYPDRTVLRGTLIEITSGTFDFS